MKNKIICGLPMLAAAIQTYVLAGVSAVMLIAAVASEAEQGKMILKLVAPEAAPPFPVVNRSSKGNRLTMPAAGTRQIPVGATGMGIDNAPTLHRGVDQPALGGNPARSSTIAGKSLPLHAPLVTGSSSAKTVTFRRDPLPPPPPATVRKRPIGCEPLFSPVTTPSLSHLTGRCIS
jgi:hypothetical protein